MTNSLIKIVNKEGKQLVNARELHEFLEVTERFQQWFDKRVSKYGFMEDEDFTSVKSFTVVNNGAQREIQDYIITTDMAKELSMLQNTDKGRQARRYFIQCEKALKELVPTLSEEQQLKLKLIDCTTVEGIIIHKQLVEIAQELTRKEERNGNNKIINLSTLVSELGIDGLTTTIFNEWLCKKGLGKMVIYQGNKNRSFRANEQFFKILATEGYSLTGQTLNGRVKVVYSTRMIDYANDNIDELIEYVQSVI